MVQELGETVQQMAKDDDKDVQEIINRRPKGHYWIVIHHKPTKEKLEGGEMVIRKVIKDYDVQPRNNLGTMVLEIKDADVIDVKINLHDAPIDWGAIEPQAGFDENPYVQHRPDIGKAYLYNE